MVTPTNNARSGYLGPFMIMAVAPIAVDMIVWLVLPWLAKVFG